MAANPYFQDGAAGPGNTTVTKIAGLNVERPVADVSVEAGRPERHLSIYPARCGYDLRDELDFLTNRAIEPNVFFSGRFLAPAMPRLEDRLIRLLVIRDENDKRSRMRFLMPFSIERPGFSVGAPILRAWANPFGPLGTPLLDREDAAETIDNLLETLTHGELDLPPVLVLPQIRMDGPFVRLLQAVALSRNLTIVETDRFERPILQSDDDGDVYLKRSVSAKHRREYRRQRRLLSEMGELDHAVARRPQDVRRRMEEFLNLEASGWKGRRRSAMVIDRYRAAFAREAIANLAETDNVRIHTLNLDGRAIASTVVFVIGGTAYTWKTAYDEIHAHCSPGQLLMNDLTIHHLEDPNIDLTDSCGVPDHPVMSRLWRERCAMGTLIVGLKPTGDRDARLVAKRLGLYQNTRNLARVVRQRLRNLSGRR